jgi:hypothetical protein
MAKLKKILSELNWGGYTIQPGQVVTYKDFPAFKTPSQIAEEEKDDHEVSMAQSSLDAIINYATQLKGKVGEVEKDLPAWIQDHISKSETYIRQASNQYHENGKDDITEDNDEWVAVVEFEGSMRKKLLKVLKSQRAAKMWMSKNAHKLLDADKVRSVGTMTKREWDKSWASSSIK